MTINIKTKQWGNSIGIIIPAEVVQELAINPGEEITVEISKRHNVLKELFGTIPMKRKTEVILRDIRNELEGDLI